MGVPKFFRWISERFPKVIQRHGSRPVAATYEKHFDDVDQKGPPKLFPPDLLSECGLAPEIDRLYVDVNGILHGCSHNNMDEEGDPVGAAVSSEEELFRNICYYLDRIVRDIAQPKELLYLAIDGVAPRAKLNQQRARRYRSAKRGEIEQTVYCAHATQLADESGQSLEPAAGSNKLFEVEPGRFAGKFQTTDMDTGHVLHRSGDTSTTTTTSGFHSTCLTPGTDFFARCSAHLRDFVERQVATDPAWKKLSVIYSGPGVPGEGEHKIMQFMRMQQQLPDYNPCLRHCIMGQDGDLIMLGLVTHEPNLVLLREKIYFDEAKRRQLQALGLRMGVYLHNPNFEFFHMNVLRDYLAYEFETSDVMDDSEFDLEHTIDDFVFMTLFVGNDFLPHMPAMDITDEAFDLLFYTYRLQRTEWLNDYRKRPHIKPYLTDSGNIVSGRRLELFLQQVGKHETSYYDYKRDKLENDGVRRLEFKHEMEITPSDDIIAAKEQADRVRFREMIRLSLVGPTDVKPGFLPVLSNGFQPNKKNDYKIARPKEVKTSEKMLGRYVTKTVDDATIEHAGGINDQDLKGRYYYDKFGFTPFDAEKHVALRKAYIEGLVWNLKYYYEGCVSWEWYYPYHYGPMLSDLVGLNDILNETSFKKQGSALRPFEQLLACLPPSHAELLPKVYRHLMVDSSSPIAEFYPLSFTVDMNGKRWPWEAVVLLPFIDSDRLLKAVQSVDWSLLTDDEKKRNRRARSYVISYDSRQRHKTIQLQNSSWWISDQQKRPKPCFRPALQPGVEVPLGGLPTLRDGVVQSVWRKKLRVNIHGTPSRYMTSCLELYNVPNVVTTDFLAQQLIGSLVFINYPHVLECFVTAVSDSNTVFRGDGSGRPWTPKEMSSRSARLRDIISSYALGEELPGTGGIIFPGQDFFRGDGKKRSMDGFQVLLNVRPFKKLETMSDGTVVKTYATFEVEVPLFVTTWLPRTEDPRLRVPLRLEKDPYNVAKRVLTSHDKTSSTAKSRVHRDMLPLESPLNLRRLSKVDRRSVLARSVSTLTMAPLLAAIPYPLVVQPAGKHPLRIAVGASELGDYLVQRKPQADRAIPVRRLRSARGRVLAAGFVAACSFLSGCGASIGSEIPVPIYKTEYPIADMKDITKNEFDPLYSKSRRTPPLQYAHGTTTVSFAFQGGIIAAVDSRASLGSFVGSKTTQKVLPVNSHMLGTMAGGAADCSFWIRNLRSEAAFFELTNDNKRISVARASRLLSNWMYENRGLGLSLGTMIMGFDDDGDGPPQIYYLDDSGMRIEGDLFAVGSGSTFALGILDTERRFDMTVEEAISLGIKAIRHATFRDAYSGGFINVFVITRKDGWKRVYSEDLARLSGPESGTGLDVSVR
jgi:5'-3' exonuclease/20S proteasome alpha/beta subunit